MHPTDAGSSDRSPGIPIYTVDAFAARPFTGNPAAVCLLERPASEEWMQAVAAEMNLSETAFVLRRTDGEWGLRWFTPSVEVDLCGHATLASAQVLWESGAGADAGIGAKAEPLVFTTRRSGKLICRRGADGWITMDFPARPAAPAEAPAGLAEALGCEWLAVGRSSYDYLVEVADAGIVRALKPDHARLARLPVRGVIVTAAGGGKGAEGFDFVSRFFAPGAGVPEDPVTGSAHCSLGPYWAARLGRTRLRAWQASTRGGEVRVVVREGGAGETGGPRVELGGQARTVLVGTLCPAG